MLSIFIKPYQSLRSAYIHDTLISSLRPHIRMLDKRYEQMYVKLHGLPNEHMSWVSRRRVLICVQILTQRGIVRWEKVGMGLEGDTRR